LSAYTTVANYVESLARFFSESFGETPEQLLKVSTQRAFCRIQGGKCPELPVVGRLLRHSWLSEIQLHVLSQDSPMLHYIGNWAPMYLYYAVYQSGRALLCAQGTTVSESHASTLRTLGNEVVTRSDLFPQPLKTFCSFDPKTTGLCYENTPDGCVIARVEPLSNVTSDDFWSRYAMLLRTTHNERIERRVEDWKRKNKRQRIPRTTNDEISSSVLPTTLFHVLYRLRIRSNYQEVDSFLAAIRYHRDSRSFLAHLQVITWHCLLVLELLTAKHLGPRKYDKMIDGFRRYDVAELSDKLANERYQLIKLVL